ncbi:hypothetical protein ACFQZQ_04235 [Lysobacter koreensis]|uniref:Uncharacterized protein n=1 Tax=Lysobacter koreensis TaxID=266122 RepID=A0ABW2YJ94_9GAMM
MAIALPPRWVPSLHSAPRFLRHSSQGNQAASRVIGVAVSAAPVHRQAHPTTDAAQANATELEAGLWKPWQGRIVLLGANGVEPRPMTARAEDGRAPPWFATARDTELAQGLEGSRAYATSAAIGTSDVNIPVQATLVQPRHVPPPRFRRPLAAHRSGRIAGAIADSCPYDLRGGLPPVPEMPRFPAHDQ